MRSKLIRVLFLLFFIFSQAVMLGQTVTSFSITNSNNSLAVPLQTEASYQWEKYPIWTNLCTDGFSEGIVDYTSLALDGNGAPYVACQDWANGYKTTSEIGKFYNVGEGGISYALFPAESVSPKWDESVNVISITLDWSGSDVDNDIASYKVFLGATSNPGAYKTNITDSFLKNVPLESGKTYYWE